MVSSSEFRVRSRYFSPLIEAIIVVAVVLQLAVAGLAIQHRAHLADVAAKERATQEALTSKSAILVAPSTTSLPLDLWGFWAVGTPRPTLVNPAS